MEDAFAHCEEVDEFTEHAAQLSYYFRPVKDTIDYIDDYFDEAFDAYELPVIERYAGYGITASSARIFLGRWLEPEQHGSFRFLDLPNELRNRICDMTLVFPRAEIEVRENKRWRAKGVNLIAKEREGGHPVPLDGCEVPNPNKLLNIAIVSKQLAKETIHVFYGSNSFVFTGPTAISSFIKVVPVNRMRLIKQVRIKTYVHSSVSETWDDKMMLAVLAMGMDTKLDNRTITIEDRRSRPTFPPHSAGYRAWKTLKDIPSLLALARFASKAKTYQIRTTTGPGSEVMQELKEGMDIELKRLRSLEGVAGEGGSL